MESSLRLIMEKGPRGGETLDFNPRSVVRIGRIVRGNTVSIKDLAISSKHLLIEQTATGRWTITDLDSSNGTLLNSSYLPPGTPFDLRDGDEVKIGEVTSIRVRFFDISASRVRRNPRRGRPPLPKNAVSFDAKKRVTEKAEVNREESARGNVEDVGVDEKGHRRGRPRSRRERSVTEEDGNGVSSSVKVKVSVDSKSPQAAGRGVSRREQNLDDERSHVGARPDDHDEGDGLHSPSPMGTCKGMGLFEEVVVIDDVGQGLTCKFKGGDVPDLGMMTLREWFDYLELYLTMQIRGVTNQVIEDMRRRADQVHNLIQEQQAVM
ncbi:hypothetical protein Dimus_001463 [Dionaea muscipula]